MKNIIILALGIVAVFFASCKKQRSCECHSAHTVTTVTTYTNSSIPTETSTYKEQDLYRNTNSKISKKNLYKKYECYDRTETYKEEVEGSGYTSKSDHEIVYNCELLEG